MAAADADAESGTWLAERAGAPATLRVRRCRLEVVAGPDAGAVRELATTPIVIGRGPADLTLADKRVSALHAEIRLEDAGYRLRNLGSTNGTFVFGLRIVEAMIGPGTTMALGDSAVRFVPLADSVELP